MSVPNKTLNLVYVALFAVLIVICSWISIPTVVPFTLQTLAIYLAIALLGWRRGLAAIVVYILLGLIGVPVFSGFRAGVGVLAGPTGGYIIGFIFLAMVMGAIVTRWGRGNVVLFLAMLAGTIVCYSFGTIWFLIIYTETTAAVSVGAALLSCVVPFIVPDILKMLAAIALYRRLACYTK